MSRKKRVTEARFSQFLQPVLDAVAALGGSARPAEVKEWILENLELPPEYTSAVHKGGESMFGNDVDWCRFYLVRAGYLDSSKRGVWSLTERGRKTRIDREAATRILREVDRKSRASDPEDTEAEPTGGHQSYVDQTLNVIMSLSPAGFERLCQRLLRESGFEEVTVTGRSGDGGIDGQGILKLNSFVSFQILFQCKRYKDTVGPDTVRDFRGAMAGRAEKGLILTTGRFTQAAEAEASRDGAQPVELVDGSALVELLASLELGLKPVTTYDVDAEFFEQFD